MVDEVLCHLEGRGRARFASGGGEGGQNMVSPKVPDLGLLCFTSPSRDFIIGIYVNYAPLL